MSRTPNPCAGRPIEQVSIAVVTGLCQLRCVYCPTHDIQRARGFVDVDFVASLLGQVQPRIVNLQGYGEPTLHPEFRRLVTLARQHAPIVKFFSHLNRWTAELADFVVEAGVRQVIVSLDATDRVTYARVRRRGDFDDLLAGVRFLSDAIDRSGAVHPEILYNIVVVRDTVEQISKVVEFVRGLGLGQPVYELVNSYGDAAIGALEEPDRALVRHQLLTARAKAAEFGWMRTLQNIDFNLASLEEVDVDAFRCYRPWRLLTVLEDGGVVPCGEYHEGQVLFGNLRNQSVAEVWDGPSARGFRERLLQGRSGLEVCRRCTVNEGATADFFDTWIEPPDVR